MDDPEKYLNIKEEEENILEERIDENNFFGSFNHVPSKNHMKGGRQIKDEEE